MKSATKCLPRRRFSVGTRVRVRPGTIDPDYSVLPLGGWAGRIVEVAADGPAPYLVRWNLATLAKIHPVYGQLCAEDDRDLEQMWLDEADLEYDAGGLLTIETPRGYRGQVQLLNRAIVRRSRSPEPPAQRQYAVAVR